MTQVVRPPKIYSPPKEERPFVLPRVFKIIIIIIIVFSALFYLFIFSPCFKIKTIEIIGSPPSEISLYLNQFKNSNIFLFNVRGMTEELKSKYPEFLDIEVSRGIPSTLRVRFEERSPKIIWQSNYKYYLVDENGLVFKVVENRPLDLPLVIDNKNLVISLPSQIATTNFVDFIINAKIKIKDYGLQINQFEINETIFQVDAQTDKNIKIIFDITRNLSDQLDAFGKVYSEHKDEIKEYLDLRVEGKVYYK